jgi:diguanylate cyclase (GGDEF)-like protein
VRARHGSRMVADYLGRRRLLVGISLAAYVGLVFVGLARVEVPGLGIGHLLYLPIALLALATGPLWGAFAGAVSAALYVLGASINVHFAPDEQLLSAGSVIRFTTYAGIGWLVGSAAASNRELMQRLKEHAERDFLTDLLNTRAFEAQLAARLERGRPFALVLADADDLKLVNDTEGHAAGNEHLRRLAAALREQTAPEDVVARIGGDEFAVLTEIDGRGEAEALSGRLQAILAERGVSASFGYAAHPEEGHDPMALFHAADKRLYASKLGGLTRGKQPVSPASPLPSIVELRTVRPLRAAPLIPVAASESD